MAGAPIAILGKLPALPDFVRLGAGSPAFQGLFAWLLDAVQQASAVRRDWLDAVPVATVDAMVYRELGASSLLAGAIAPSADRAGRRFPIVTASELRLVPAMAQHPEVLPLVLERLWAVTGALVQEMQALDRGDVEASQPSVEVDTDIAAALQTYRGWTDELELEDFLELVFDADLERAARAIALVEEAVHPYRGIEGPDTPLSVRLPLGQSGGATVCFWLDLVKRLAGWRATVPSFFWSHDGAAGALLLHLGRVPAVALSELWLPTAGCEQVCDLVLPGARDWHTDRVDYWGGQLGQPGHSLSDLLRAAESLLAGRARRG
jgi:type VI secretion system ImpM family protein